MKIFVHAGYSRYFHIGVFGTTDINYFFMLRKENWTYRLNCIVPLLVNSLELIQVCTLRVPTYQSCLFDMNALSKYDGKCRWHFFYFRGTNESTRLTSLGYGSSGVVSLVVVSVMLSFSVVFCVCEVVFLCVCMCLVWSE